MLVKALRTMKARMGDRSSVPPSGGMMPRKMFRYGSHIVLHMALKMFRNYSLLSCSAVWSIKSSKVSSLVRLNHFFVRTYRAKVLTNTKEFRIVRTHFSF